LIDASFGESKINKCMFRLKGSTFKSPLITKVRDPHLTQSHLPWHLNPSGMHCRVHKCDRQTTDHTTEKRTAIRESAGAKTISHNNDNFRSCRAPIERKSL